MSPVQLRLTDEWERVLRLWKVINNDTGEGARLPGLFVLIAFSSVGVPNLPRDNGRPCLVLTSAPVSSGGAALCLSGRWTAFASGNLNHSLSNQTPSSRKTAARKRTKHPTKWSHYKTNWWNKNELLTFCLLIYLENRVLNSMFKTQVML